MFAEVAWPSLSGFFAEFALSEAEGLRTTNIFESQYLSNGASVLSLKFVKEMIFSLVSGHASVVMIFCLVSGHDFSRAVNGAKQMGFSP
ncbi:MAG: hypothetical protein ACYCPM_12945 [Acidobacteriaceae bacterium]